MCPPPAPRALRVRGTHLAVGFGSVSVERDGETIWTGDDDRVSLYRFERLARTTPGRWTVYFYGPMSDELYVRTGFNTWTLESRGQGFA
jgi:hypothetical protein